ncbi:MAG: HD-GYP domain-containing protein [Gemmatimonadota bacterium]
MRIVIIDDDPANTEFLRHVLEPEGYGELIEFTDPARALERIEEADPDLVVLDLMMPELDGYTFLDRMRRRFDPGDFRPVLVVTGDTSVAAQRRALSLGARDFLTKPLSPADIRLRVRNLLETRFLHARLREYNALLEERVVERTRELETTRLEILDRLARAAEYRDDDTGEHTQRVGRVAARLAEVLGQPERDVQLIRRAAPLHDIGKIGIPDAILLKPGRLTEHERSVMQDHTRIGADILSGSRSPLLQLAEEIAYVHHERWDGAGYPDALAGEVIPLVGRIVAVADVFDSLTHERPYKRAWSVREALQEIRSNAGAHFDPVVVEALLKIAPEVRVLQREAGEQTLPAVRPDAPADPVAARLRELEEERDELLREVRDLRREVARREQRISELAGSPS